MIIALQLIAGLVGFGIIACMKIQQSRIKAESSVELKLDDTEI